jgi:Holliday junction resolvase RusA-like endonuclease
MTPGSHDLKPAGAVATVEKEITPLERFALAWLMPNFRLRGKERPRFNGKTGRTYTPKKTQDLEELIRKVAKQALQASKQAMTRAPLAVRIHTQIEVPKSYTKKQRQMALDGEIIPPGDVDNLAKTVLDSLNGVTYLDDKQVMQLVSTKQYGETDAVSIHIWEVHLVRDMGTAQEAPKGIEG